MSEPKPDYIFNFTSFSYFVLLYSILDFYSYFYWSSLCLSLFLTPCQAAHCCMLVVCFEVLNFFSIGFQFFTGNSLLDALKKSNEARAKEVLKDLDQSNITRRLDSTLNSSLNSFRYRQVDGNSSLSNSTWSQSLNESSLNSSWLKGEKFNDSIKFREFRGTGSKNSIGPNALELSFGSSPHNSVYTDAQYSQLMFKTDEGHHTTMNESSFVRKIDYVFSGTQDVKDYQLGYCSSAETKLDASLKNLSVIQDAFETESADSLNKSDLQKSSQSSSPSQSSSRRLSSSKDEYTSRFARKAAKLRDVSLNLSSTSSLPIFTDSKKFGLKESTITNVVVHKLSIHDDQLLGLSQFSLKFRLFMRESVLKPFVDAVDSANNDLHKINANFTIGNSSLDVLQLAMEHKKELVGTQLPFLLPFLKIHQNQYYLVRRIRQLAKTPLLQGYEYNKSAKIEPEEGSETDLNISERPIDSELLFSFFCVYMDHCVVPDSLAKVASKPFTSLYTLRENTLPSFVQRIPTSFYIRMKHQTPEGLIFDFVSNGSTDVYTTKAGPENLFASLYLFFKHCTNNNDGYLGEMRLDSKGLNMGSLLT